MATAVSMNSSGPRCGNGIEQFTVGVEEEFVLVDPVTGRPSLTSTAVAAAASGIEVQLELSKCQLETSTPVCTTIPALRDELGRARLLAAQAAARAEARLLALGVPLWLPPTRSLTETPRYRRMAEWFGELTEQVICGCHVHVCVPDREVAVQVSNHLRPWLPTLLALTANSPITGGSDTGYASWRHLQWSRWPSAGPPPYFRSAGHYDDAVEMLRESGSILDTAMVYWDVRLSAHLPTIEIRISDVPATVAETVLLATLVRALVVTAVAAVDSGRLADPIDQGQLRSACWRAARDGLAGSGFDIATRRLVPAVRLLNRLLSYTRPCLEESGDYAHTRDAIAAVLAGGNGAMRQRRALRTDGLMAVLGAASRLTTEGCRITEGGQPALER
ncbi:glutamate--cysteine ligase [Streptomyces gardneri]|nr:glutamate--cysteine ligase [Streptomyces gardneri]